MHENETPPRSPQPKAALSEQIPHSGIHHDERPVETFDRTPLSEAVARGLVNPIPDSAAILTPETGKKNHKKLMIGLSAGIAGAAIAAGAIMGLKVAGESSNSQNTGPAPADPKATSETTPVPIETATSPEVLTVKSVEIPTGLTPEQLGATFMQRLDSWEMSGVTPANYQLWLNANGSTAGDAVVAKIAQQNGAIYAEALFGPDWMNRPDVNSDLHPYVKNHIASSATSMQLGFETQPGNDARDKEPYRRWTTVDTVNIVSHTDATTVERIDFTEHDNAVLNRAGQLSGGKIDGATATALVTFTTLNGAERVTSFDIVRR